ncbi:MAG: hypothetical protein ABSH10_07525 [Phycisphaerae bacterium]|jgi:hypothetical protein
MVYRIRYRQRADGRETEAVVEASNPTEALIKFRCTYGLAHAAGGAESVTSVPNEAEDQGAADLQGEHKT